MKTSENDVQYSNFNMGEKGKSRDLYSREGDTSSRFEGKTVAWEHTLLQEGKVKLEKSAISLEYTMDMERIKHFQQVVKTVH